MVVVVCVRGVLRAQRGHGFLALCGVAGGDVDGCAVACEEDGGLETYA